MVLKGLDPASCIATIMCLSHMVAYHDCGMFCFSTFI